MLPPLHGIRGKALRLMSFLVARKGRPRQECKTTGGVSVCDQEIKNNLKALRNKKFHTQMGYRKLMHFLRRDFDLIINHKKVYRLYSEAGLTLPEKKKSKRRGRKQDGHRT